MWVNVKNKKCGLYYKTDKSNMAFTFKLLNLIIIILLDHTL